VATAIGSSTSHRIIAINCAKLGRDQSGVDERGDSH
jgi:hypothetical protein